MQPHALKLTLKPYAMTATAMPKLDSCTNRAARTIRHRGWIAAALACLTLALSPSPTVAQAASPAGKPTTPAATTTPTTPTGQPPKILRYAFRVAETGFDPAQVNDLYSRTITPHIFEGLYTYDHLARPYKVRPLTADGMPTISADFKTWTVKVQPGIYFADDPAFKGQKRELVAADYVYAFKRYADPKLKSPNWTYLEQYGILGLRELRKAALNSKQPLDYDKPIEGLKVLDRYTVQFNLDSPRPRFIDMLATGDLFGAVAREVAETYGDQIAEHPVGTGPFRLKQWRRSSLIVLERNPTYRDKYYDAEPAPDDKEGQALLAKLKGRKLPMLDGVEISIIEEEQPRWLSYLNDEHDFVELLPPEFITSAMPNGKIAPNLAKRGMQPYAMVRADILYMMYNMENPVIGGYTPEKIALRRALNLGYNVEREIRLARRNQAIVAHSPTVPHTVGFDASFKSEMGEYNPAKARALLDLYGYRDVDGDGWRELPDGSPLTLMIHTQPDGLTRQLDELRTKDLGVLGIRVEYKTAKWPENLKATRGGNYMMWGVGSSAAGPDGQTALTRLHGPQVGGTNIARFKLKAFDDIFDRMSVLPDGPERMALFDQAKRLAVAYAPMKAILHRIVTDMAQPWLIGYRRPLFWQEWWHMVDIDTAKLPTSMSKTLKE
jgi:ABC-type transport system substrate-binding protein